MKRSFVIVAAVMLLALSLAGCGARRNGDPDSGTTGTTATDTMQNGAGVDSGTGTSSGASANNGTSLTEGVAGALNRAIRRDEDRIGTDNRNAGLSAGNRAAYGIGGPNSSVYTATNNGGVTADGAALDAARSAAEANLRYAKMLANARVHDRDGFLLDGENAHFSTF